MTPAPLLDVGEGELFCRTKRKPTMMKHVDDKKNDVRGISPIPRIALNVTDAAAALGISREKLHELRRAGEIPCVVLGRETYLFDPADLAAWRDRNKTQPGEKNNG